MKTFRWYLAQVVYFVIWHAFLPFAVVRVATEWLIDCLVIPTLDSLQVIINDK